MSNEKRKTHRRKSDARLPDMGIDELERLLQDDESTPIEILPNGEIRAVGSAKKVKVKPLTYQERLGGEYAA